MITILTGDEPYLCSKELKRIICASDPQQDHNDTVFFDASSVDFDLQEAIQECDGIPFFHDRKVVVLENPYFLRSKSKDKNKNEDPDEGLTEEEKLRLEEIAKRNVKVLKAYCDRPNDLCDLIFYLKDYFPDSRKKEYKYLIEHQAILKKFDKLSPQEFDHRVSQLLQEHSLHLDHDARKELTLRLGVDLTLLYNAIEKLEIYHAENYTKEDIRSLIPENPEIDIFLLGEAFVKGNRSEATYYAQQMLNRGYAIQNLFYLLAGNIRATYLFKLLNESGMNSSQISKRTGKNEYYIRMRLQSNPQISSSSYLKYLSQMAKMDQDMKSGRQPLENAFPMFLLGSES